MKPLPPPPRGTRALGEEAIEAARERQAGNMKRRKRQGFWAGIISAPVLMLVVGFLLGWGFFPPAAATIDELAGSMIVTEHCMPVVIINSVATGEAKALDKAIAAWEEEVRADGSNRNVGAALYPQVLEGRIIFMLYRETCQTPQGGTE